MKKLYLHNDNNKLHCRSFIHICLAYEPWPTDVGYEIYTRQAVNSQRTVPSVFLGEAKIIDRRASTISKLNESVAAITTGYSLQVLKASLAASIVQEQPVTEESKIYVITFRYLKYAKDHPLCTTHHTGGRRDGRQLVAIP